MGKYNDSLKEIKIALDYSSKNEYFVGYDHKCHYYHALILIKLDKFNESRNEFEKSIQMYEKYGVRNELWHKDETANYYYEYGMLLLNKFNEQENALKQFKIACNMDADNVLFKTALH
eukprot:453596_1